MAWVLTLLGIVMLIVLHEFGHFLVAKAVGMRVERFSLFFPPTLLRVRRGETEYALGALPLGGYVKITGMSPEELKAPQHASAAQPLAAASALPGVGPGRIEETGPDVEGTGSDQPAAIDPEVLRRAYYNQAPWKRIVVILAGPGMNILIALALFWAMLAVGNANGAGTLEALNPSIPTRVPTTTVAGIIKGEPAEAVLRPGDRILAVEGRPAAVASAERAIDAHRCAGALTANCRAATPVSLTVKRAGRTLTVSVYPRYDKEIGRMLVGFDFGVAAKGYSVLGAASTSLHEMWAATTSLVSNLGRAFTSEKVRHELHSIVGITEIAHETVEAGAGYALVFLGFISLILAVVNLFPFLPLDGGHILWSVAEKVRGRRISLAAMYRYSTVGIVLMIFLVINGLSNDISRLAH